MINQSLLNIVMLVEIFLLVLAVVVFFTHGVWLVASQKRFLRDMIDARDPPARLLTRGAINA